MVFCLLSHCVIIFTFCNYSLTKNESLSIERSIKNNKNKTHSFRLKLLDKYAIQYNKDLWKNKIKPERIQV